MLEITRMTNTEFIVREKGGHHPLFPRKVTHFKVVDGAFILGFLAVFVGLVLLLSK
jgi:hypothetical protein